ncbi:MAG: hypothetical protein ACPGJS_07585 [Flammeovirgaceae bacterium]
MMKLGQKIGRIKIWEKPTVQQLDAEALMQGFLKPSQETKHSTLQQIKGSAA